MTRDELYAQTCKALGYAVSENHFNKRLLALRNAGKLKIKWGSNCVNGRRVVCSWYLVG